MIIKGSGINPAVITGFVLTFIIVSYILTKREPLTWGASVDGALRAYHVGGAIISPRSLLVKIIATSLLVGSGASVGLLGPGIFIGGGVVGLLMLIRHIPFAYRRRLFLAGVAGVLSSIFRAPLGAVIYALEAPYHRDLETRAIVPVVVSSLTSYTVTVLLLGFKPMLPSPRIDLCLVFNPLLLAAVLLLGLFNGYFSALWADLYRLFNHLSRRLKYYLQGVIIAFTIVLISTVLPYSSGTGQLLVAGLLESHTDWFLPPGLLLAVLAARFLLSTFITGFRGSGGLFAPGIVIGALTGYLASMITGMGEAAPIFVLAGMASFYGGVSTTPIGTSLIIAEMTGTYPVILPILVSALAARETVRRRYLYVHQRDRKLYRIVEDLRNIYEAIVEANPVFRSLRVKRFRGYMEKPAIRGYRDVSVDLQGLLTYMILTGREYVVVVHGGGPRILTMDSLVYSLTHKRKPVLVSPPLHGLEDTVEAVVEDATRRNSLYTLIASGREIYVLPTRRLYYALAIEYLGLTSTEKPG